MKEHQMSRYIYANLPDAITPSILLSRSRIVFSTLMYKYSTARCSLFAGRVNSDDMFSNSFRPEIVLL